MTIILILGAVAGLYSIWLLFRLAVYALPVYAGLATAFLMLGNGLGYPGSIAGGLIAGMATLLIGQLLFAFIRSPLLRVVIALSFAVPAGIAGYHAIQGLAGLAIDDSLTLRVPGLIGAFVTAFSAWRSVAQTADQALARSPKAIPTTVSA